MNTHDALLYVHILGWVFWLGTDVGVFLSARYAERGDLSPETRLTVLQLGMVLDRFPRFAMPLVWLTGVLLMNRLGYALVPGVLAAVVTVFWLGVTWIIIFLPQVSAPHRWAARAQTVILCALILGMGSLAISGLVSGSMALWLALKWIAFALIGVTVLLLEKTFAPMVPLLAELAERGGSDDLNARISAVLKPVYPVVLAIYLWTLLAAASGVSKISY